VQSFFDSQLEFLRRGHTAKQSIQAIEKIASSTAVDLGIHLMFGLPNETEQQIIETARYCNELPIQNVKLHNLHVLTNTPLEQLYHEGKFSVCDRPQYSEKVALFLSYLSPRIFVHRLAAFAPRWNELVAPAWTGDKMGTHQFLIDYLNSTSTFQGKSYSPEMPFKEI
jgi:radical SAM superfamily enzyme